MTDNRKMREAMIDQDGAVWEKIGGAWSLYKPEQSVPVEVSDSPCAEADGCPTEKSVLQRFWREAQSVAVVWEPVAWACPYHAGEVTVNGTPCVLVSANCVNSFGKERGFPLQYVANATTTAELATLREKAAMVDEAQSVAVVGHGMLEKFKLWRDERIGRHALIEPLEWFAGGYACAKSNPEQSVPVVGEPVAWDNFPGYLIDHQEGSIVTEENLQFWLSAFIKNTDYNKPAESITATEPERLRKDAERYRWLRDGNDNKKSAACHIAVNCYGLEWDDAIDAALAQGKGE